MKKTGKMIMLFALFGFVLRAGAQGHDGMPKREMMEQRFRQMSERLQLDAGQQEKIKSIVKAHRQEMKKLREEKRDAGKDEKRAAFIAQFKKTDDQINAILNPHQQELYKQYKEEKKAERKQKMQERKMEHEQMEEGLF